MIENNPLLRKLNKMPGETFRLPSKGLPYKNGELSDSINGELVVYPMSTLDEIYMRTPDMLFQGSAVERVLKKCVPQIQTPLKLIPKDVDYILTCLRKVSYGNQMVVTYKCENKLDSKEKEYSIDINQFIIKSKELDSDFESKVSFDLDNYFFIIKYASYDDILKLSQKNNNGLTPEELYESIVDGLCVNIQSIDGIEDREQIREFITEADRNFQLKLADKINDINEWGTEFTYNIQCKDCNKNHDIMVSLNPVSFFSLPSSPKIDQE